MKVLLVSANTLREPYPVYPLGLDYVASAIAVAHEVHCLDLNSLEDNDGFPHAVRAFEPDIIGFSLRNVDNTDALNPQGFMAHYLEVTEALRRCSTAPIVLGGTGFTLFPHESMRTAGGRLRHYRRRRTVSRAPSSIGKGRRSDRNSGGDRRRSARPGS